MVYWNSELKIHTPISFPGFASDPIVIIERLFDFLVFYFLLKNKENRLSVLKTVPIEHQICVVAFPELLKRIRGHLHMSEHLGSQIIFLVTFVFGSSVRKETLLHKEM